MASMANMANVSVEEFLRQPATLLYMGSNPHRLGSNAHAMYEKARGATSVGEIRSMGISLWDLRGYVEKETIKLITGPAASKEISDDMSDSRLKASRASFKEKPVVNIEVAAETIAQSKQRRQDRLDKIRQLQVVKDKFSPAKASGESWHDEDYDLSAEIRSFNVEPVHFDFSDDSEKKDDKSNESSKEFSDQSIIMHSLSNLFDQKLSLLHESISSIETK